MTDVAHQTKHALRNRVMQLPSHKAVRQALHPPKTLHYVTICGNSLGSETGKALMQIENPPFEIDD